MSRVDLPGPGTVTVQFQALLFQLQYPHADGVPVVTMNLANEESQTLWSYTPGEYTKWPHIFGIDLKPACVLQLTGLLQFECVPRHPQKGQRVKWINWGYRDGVFRTKLYHQAPSSKKHKKKGSGVLAHAPASAIDPGMPPVQLSFATLTCCCGKKYKQKHLLRKHHDGVISSRLRNKRNPAHPCHAGCVLPPIRKCVKKAA
jgi:hypothetical protein